MTQPWYRNGLRFRCKGCGDCCTGAPGFVWVNKGEIHLMAVALGLSVEEFEAQYVRHVGIRKSLIEYDNGDCVFFDSATGGCQLYHARPRQCRTWPFWESNVRTPQAWAATAAHCSGCDAGRLFSREEIEKRVAERRL